MLFDIAPFMLYSYWTMTTTTSVRQNWQEIIKNGGFNTFLNLNPETPGLRVHEMAQLGETLAKRIKDRANLPAGSVILIPENCAQDLWHYHGFVAATTSEQFVYLRDEAAQMLEHAMKTQIVRKFRPNRYQGTEPRASALIEPLGDEPDGAIYYATKYWDVQHKGETIIYL